MSSFRELQITFAAAGLSALFVLEPGETADYSVAGTFTGTVDLEISSAPGSRFETFVAGTANTGYSGTLTNDAGEPGWYRFRSKSWIAAEIWTSFGEGVQEVSGVDRIGIVRGVDRLLALTKTPARATASLAKKIQFHFLFSIENWRGRAKS